MPINGLFGWVRHNDARSVALFLIFAIAIQLMAATVLTIPLIYFDPHHCLIYSVFGYFIRYVPGIAIAAVVWFALQMWWHIQSMQRLVDFHYVDSDEEPRLCSIVELNARTMGLKSPFVAVTESPALNAFACGITPSRAVAVFTRGLIDALDDDELANVIAHELSHIKNLDIRLMASANIFMNTLKFLRYFNQLRVKSYKQIIAFLFFPLFIPMALVAGFFSQCMVRLGIGSRFLIASSREYIADAEAIQVTQTPDAMVTALQKIEGNSEIKGLAPELDGMMIDGAIDGIHATHPSIHERIAVLASLTGSLTFNAGVRRDTRPNHQQASKTKPTFGRRSLDLRTVAARAKVSSRPPLSSLLKITRDDAFGMFGMRWDLGIALVATFITAPFLHGMSMKDFLGKQRLFYEHPDAKAQAIKVVMTCGMTVLKAETSGNEDLSSCNHDSPQFKRLYQLSGMKDPYAAQAELRNNMLSDNELYNVNERAKSRSSLYGAGIISGGQDSDEKHRAPTAFAESYSISVHEAYERLTHGSLWDYIISQNCGFVVQPQMTGEPDKTIIWDMKSDGETFVRFQINLKPINATTTRVSLAIEDNEKTNTAHFDGSGGIQSILGKTTMLRPLLEHPLRPAFTEAAAAMLDSRPFSQQRVASLAEYPERFVETYCSYYRQRFERDPKFVNIHDQTDHL